MKRPLPSAFARRTASLAKEMLCAPWRCGRRRAQGRGGLGGGGLGRGGLGRGGLGLAGARSGVAAIEFVLTAPILSVLFIGSIDAAQLFMGQLKLSSAVFAGADYALVNASDVSSAAGAQTLANTIATIVGTINGAGSASGTVVVNNGPTATFTGSSSISGGTASNATLFYCLTGSPGAWVWGTGQASSASCGTNQAASGKFVTISATASVTPLIAGLSFTPATIHQSVAVQVQ